MESCDAAYHRQLEGSNCSVAPAHTGVHNHTQENLITHTYSRGDWDNDELYQNSSYNRSGHTRSSVQCGKPSDMVQCIMTSAIITVQVAIARCSAFIITKAE